MSLKGNPVFYKRLIWPLHSKGGRLIGFAGRRWDNKQKTAKYVNSPETVLHKKRDFLFNLNRAAKAISIDKFAIIVEGFTDVMAVDQTGMSNVVSLGNSAITVEQLLLIERHTKNITVCVDGDAVESAVKIVKKASSQMNVRVVALGEQDDPASWIKACTEKEGAEETAKRWRARIEEAENGILWMAGREATRAGNDPDRRYEAAREMAQLVATIKVSARREYYIREVTAILDAGLKIFQKLVQEYIPVEAPEKEDETDEDQPDRFIKIKDTFFEFSVTYDDECNIYSQDYVVRKPKEIERERGKDFVQDIPRYNPLCI